jgi:hypothetical protein
MEIDRLEVGMHVKIADDISITDKRFQSNDSMSQMRGKIYEIKDINRDIQKIRVGDYVWDPRDLIEVEDEKEGREAIFHFDPSVL